MKKIHSIIVNFDFLPLECEINFNHMWIEFQNESEKLIARIYNNYILQIYVYDFICAKIRKAERKGKLHFFLEILAFFQNFSKLFGKMPRFSPIFWKSDFSKFLIFFYSFGGRLQITFHASENYF